MSNQIPGVPEGWEAVSFDYVSDGEWWLDKDCYPTQHTSSVRAQSRRLIIRKIEKPAKYRPFANAQEFKPHRDRWVRVVGDCDDCSFDPDDIGDACKVQLHNDTSIIFWHDGVGYHSAFQCLVFDDDGTPFGVRIDE